MYYSTVRRTVVLTSLPIIRTVWPRTEKPTLGDSFGGQEKAKIAKIVEAIVSYRGTVLYRMKSEAL